MAFAGTGSNTLYLQGPLGAYRIPFFISVWTAGTSTTQGTLAGFVNGAPTTSNNMNAVFLTTGGKFSSIIVGTGAGIAEPTVTTGGNVDGFTYSHVLYAQYSPSSFELFVNGVSRITSAAAASALSDRFLVGGSNNANPLPITRFVAEICLGFGAINPAQVAAIAQGVQPMTIPGLGVAHHWPLQRDLRDIGPRQFALASVGAFTPVFRAHPVLRLQARARPRPWTTSGAVVTPPARRPRITMVA